MWDELRKILELLGLSPLWASIILLSASSLAYLFKRNIDLRNELKKARLQEIDKQLLQYSRLQIVALLETYRMLYESKETYTSRGDQFSERVKKAEDMITKPFTEYFSYLDRYPSIQGHVYAIWGVLIQSRYKPSEVGIKSFFKKRVMFFHLIQDAINAIQQVQK